MLTSEERTAALHAKMKARRVRERRITNAIGGVCAVLTAVLFLFAANGGVPHNGGVAGTFSGSTMLYENAGGYVLLAIAAFMAGVIVTVGIQHFRKKEENTENGVSGSKEQEEQAETCKERGNDL